MNRMLFVFILFCPLGAISQTTPDDVKAICHPTGIAFMGEQTDNSYSTCFNAKMLDNGSFSINHPDDSLTFRIYHPSFGLDFEPNPDKTAAEISTNLPEELRLSCKDLIQSNYVGLFAIHSSGSWGSCVSQIVMIDSIDYCLNDTSLTKICVAHSDGTPVSNVNIAWTSGSTSKTLANYRESCIYAKPNTSKSIFLVKADEYDLGISSFDLLLIKKHILGIKIFENEAQFLAADVNNTGTITTKDLLDLRKLILGKTNFFPGNSIWRFFPKFWLEDGFDWKNLGLGPTLNFDPKEFGDRPYEFTAIKVGDVSGIPSN